MDRNSTNQTSMTEAPPSPVTVTEPLTGSRPNARRSGPGRLINLALGGALVLAIAGVAFAVGRVTAPAPLTAGAFPGGNGGQFPIPSGGVLPGGGNGARGGPFGAGGVTVEGTVESISDTTLTLKTADGQTIQIALDGTTAYHAQSDATVQDVTTGATVLVRLNLGEQGGTGTGTGSSANDVTVVP